MIRIITEPSVYLIARQAIDDGELARFLAAEGAPDWTTDAPSPGEKIVETAGRLCFDDQTELLTPWGWKPVGSLGEDFPVATMNPETGQFEYQLVDAFHAYPYDGDLLTFEGRDVSFSVTPEHRQYAARSRKSGFGEFKMERTDELLSSFSFKVRTSADGWNGRVPDRVEMPSVEYQQAVGNGSGSNLAVATRSSRPFSAVGSQQVVSLGLLAAHYVANGSIVRRKGSGAGVVIYGRETDEIRRLAAELGLPSSVWVDSRNGCPRTFVGGGISLAAYFEWACGRGFAAKKLPGWVMDLPADYLAQIWDILVRTDGHRSSRGRECFYTGSEAMVGQASEILAKLGFAASSVIHGSTKTCCWSVRKKDRPSAVVRSERVRRTPYRGNVYCVTTRNGIVYVRRNGKMHYSGNCYSSYAKPRPGGNAGYIGHILDVGHGSVTEHAVWTVVITGVSRSLTHELIRHRVGISPSQLSQRFVDEGDCAFVVPPGLIGGDDTKDPDLHFAYQSWRLGCEYARDCYMECAGRLAQRAETAAYEEYRGDFAEALCDGRAVGECPTRDEWLARLSRDRRTAMRKRAREAARSVLPNATETKVALTGNARAWRHLIEMRGDPSADLEFVRLAVALARLFKGEAPNLFADFEVVEVDGIECVRSEHRKV